MEIPQRKGKIKQTLHSTLMPFRSLSFLQVSDWLLSFTEIKLKYEELFVNLVRAISINSLIPESIWAVSASLSQFLILNVGVWNMDLMATIVWFI
ncbi:hypothetical protein Vsou_05570 [Vulcanisaeta souniana JCM 11219]|uniref:Uncharacterized protein n=2 Tax=Vulcanisaeta souniana JCM 11219 TaxID=1293586 RepID=A0ABM8BKH8_9CREN|nr:hypothetical protein Vsou_05570 [Vulcanisaeta souniana JCM 11219]